MEKAIIITAPSGAGKTTLVKMLLEKRNDISFSVSACTRKRRENEIDGKDYYFLSIEDFNQKVKEDAFIEFEEVYEGMCYGTLTSEVDRIWELGKAVIFDIDVKGAVNLKKKFGDKAIAIFIDPPSIDDLMFRLKGRGTESEDTMNKRLAKANRELDYKKLMDTSIVNDNLQEAFTELNDTVSKFLQS